MHIAIQEWVCIRSKRCCAAQIAALAVALKYAASPEFKTYAKQVSSDKQASQAMLSQYPIVPCVLCRDNEV